MEKKILKIIEFLIGVVILITLIYKIGIKDVYYTIMDTKPFYSIFAFIVLFLVLILGAINIRLFAKCLGYSIKFSRIVSTYILTWVIGLVLPIRISSISLIALLKKDKIKVKDCVAITFVDKIITLIMLFILTFIGLVYFFPKNEVIKYLAVFSALIIIITIITFSTRLEMKFAKILRFFKLDDINGFSVSSKKIIKNKPLVALNTVITVIKLIITALIPYIIISGFKAYHINVAEFILVSILITAISSIPITASGLGVRELSAVVLFSNLMGINKVVITSTYLIFLFLKYILSIVFMVWYFLNSLSIFKKND